MAVTRPAAADAPERVGRHRAGDEGIAPRPQLDLSYEHVAGAVVLRCTGSVDRSTAEELCTEVESTVAAVVVVDLGELDCLDTEAAEALEQAFRGRRSNHRSFFVVAPPGSAAERTYRLVRRGRQRVVSSVDAALHPG
jgi:anti-anti-sigma regulatory factor